MIEVQDLSVRYGDFVAVKGVSFSVAAGETFGLVGESGSGKSTILQALAGLADDWSGSMSVDGLALVAGARRSLAFRKHLQMVFQDPYGSLHPHQTVDQILSSPARIHGFGSIDRRIAEVMEAVGLGPQFRFRLPHQLSGGQRQRVAIARALIVEPKVLLLDEPTSALDASVQAEILNLLVTLRHERGLTYLLVTHDLSVVAYLCDRLAVMEKGSFVETQPIEALETGAFDQDYTRRLFAAAAR
ncbi:ABC transporter ATP-binding protein [Radicibacter daui]|uniref:ABC transporter ATP-binding protein n=1 Tax=Radicibacter daui TaxID=3064829 RepID=UPI004046CEA7